MRKETNLNLKKLFSSSDSQTINVDGNDSPTEEPEYIRGILEDFDGESAVMVRELHPRLIAPDQMLNTINNLSSDGQFRNKTLTRSFSKKKKKRRKKRYIRFPIGEGGRYSGKYYGRPIYPRPPLIEGTLHLT